MPSSRYSEAYFPQVHQQAYENHLQILNNLQKMPNFHQRLPFNVPLGNLNQNNYYNHEGYDRIPPPPSPSHHPHMNNSFHMNNFAGYFPHQHQNI